MKITISGKPGSGKSTIAKELSKKLKLKHFSIGDFMREMALAKKMSLLKLGKLSEKDKSIDKELDEKQIQLGKKENNFIIDSRLGFYFIPNSIKIFLDVEIKESAKRIFNHQRNEEKENTTIKKTINNINRRIKSEKKRYKKYYNIDYPDKKYFDIFIDTSNLSVKQIVDKILKRINDIK